MKYRSTSSFVILIGSLLVLTSLVQAKESRPPNIVLFFVDDMGYVDLRIRFPEFGIRRHPAGSDGDKLLVELHAIADGGLGLEVTVIDAGDEIDHRHALTEIVDDWGR